MIKKSASSAMTQSYSLTLVYLLQDTPLVEAWLFFCCFASCNLYRINVDICSPQVSVQGLDHCREAPARLVQIDVARAQARAHGLLHRRAEEMRCVSSRPGRVEVQRAREHCAALLSASPPAGCGARARGRGRAAHRQSALKHRERPRALTANPRHV